MKKLVLSSIVAVTLFSGVSYAKDSLDNAIDLAKDIAVTAAVETVSTSVTTLAGTTCATVFAPALLSVAIVSGVAWGVGAMLDD